MTSNYEAARREIEAIFREIGHPLDDPSVAPRPRCRYLADEPILAGEAARIGLPTLRVWTRCELGHGVKGTDGQGYICGCAPWPDGGCGGCPSYVAAE